MPRDNIFRNRLDPFPSLRRFLSAAVTAFTCAWFATAGTLPTHAAEPYRLGVQDKVRIKVFEWRPSRDELYQWEALTDEFTVNPAGVLSLPFVGEIQAAGATTTEIALAISERLRTRMGMAQRPDATVEVTTFRPIYVSGNVERPGEFSYRPGLTVLQATALAGGLQRVNPLGQSRIEREIIGGRGDLFSLNLDLKSLRVRKVRLETELKEEPALALPSDLNPDGDAALTLIVNQEKIILQVRRTAFETQVAALQNLTMHLEKEIQSLTEQLELEDKQISLIKKELQSVSSLVDKGLAVSSRVISLERSLTQAEGDRLRLSTSLLRVRQEISKTEIALIELKNKRRNDAALELRETQAKLDATIQKLETSKRLLAESETAAPLSLAERLRVARAQPTYTIFRLRDGAVTSIPSSVSTLVEPGDTVQVQLPIVEDDPEPLRTRSDAQPVAERGRIAVR